MRLKILNYFKENWRNLAFLTDTVAFVLQMYLFIEKRPENRMLQSVLLIVIIAEGVVSWLLFRSLWRRKWRARATARMQRLFAGLQKFIERIVDKTGLQRKKSKNSILEGKTTIRFDKGGRDREYERVRAEKQPKWKHLSDNRGRMRFLYRGMIISKIRKGAQIYSSETPSEIERNQEKTPREQQLFDMYIRCRYDERQFPDPTELQRIKEDLNIN